MGECKPQFFGPEGVGYTPERVIEFLLNCELVVSSSLHGRAVQVDPIKPKLKPPGTKRLKPNCDVLLSISAFEFNLRRYITALSSLKLSVFQPDGRGLHSPTSQLNLSRFGQ